jgi:hypothetical protein
VERLFREGFSDREEKQKEYRNHVAATLKDVFDTYANYVRSRAEERCRGEGDASPFAAVDTALSSHVETLCRLGKTIVDLASEEGD